LLLAFVDGLRGHRGVQTVAPASSRQGIERSDVRETLGHRLRDLRSPQEVARVLEWCVRAGFQDRADLGVRDAVEVLQSQSDPVGGCWPRGERFRPGVDEVAELRSAIRAARTEPDLSSGP